MPYESLKNGLIILYVFLSSAFLMYITEIKPDGALDQEYFSFMFIFWSGGFSFHFLSKLISTPISEQNFVYWKEMGKKIISIYMAITATYGLMYATALANLKLGLSDNIYFVQALILFVIGVSFSIAMVKSFTESLTCAENNS